MKLQIEGINELIQAIEDKKQEIRRAVYAEVETTAYEVRSKAVRRVQQSSASGAVYEKYNPRRTHQASAPGEAPATDTGALANSITVRGRSGDYYVISDIRYAPMLEFGTSRMDARPFLFPSLEEARPQFEQNMRGILQ